MDLPWIAAQFPSLTELRPLARGGQKVVLAATHPVEGNVVLKLLLRTTGADRLEREVLAGQLVECDHVPRVYETGTLRTQIGEHIWLREQRVDGVTLRTKMEAGALDLDTTIRLGVHLLTTLARAESKRIVHRDIKPENVMFDRGEKFWLLDFGLSRHLDLESLTATRNDFGVGTLGYSPPEQMRNRKRDIDGRSDLFALGVVLYESIAGTNPFRAGARDQLEILRRVEQMQLPRLQVNNDSFTDLVASLLQKHPTQRPRSVADALGWMTEIASSRPSRRPPTTGVV